MIWLKRLGYLVGGVVALIVLLLIVVYVITSIRMGKHYEVAAIPIVIPTDSAGMARGRHLAVAIGKCVACHGDDLGGAQLDDNFMFLLLAASNLTSGKGGVGPRYDEATLARAIRHGVRHDGTPLRVMPSQAFQYLSNQDVGALVGYIRARPPVDREFRATRVGPVARILSLFTGYPLIPARVVNHGRPNTSSMVEEATAAYGKYLVDVGGCTGCHGPGLSGGSMGPSTAASNLTPAGIGSWTEADFFRALREGKRPAGTPISEAMPWKLAGEMTDSEIHSVWLYLKSVPAKAFGGH